MTPGWGAFVPRAQNVEEALLVCASTPAFAGWYRAATAKDEKLAFFDSALLRLIESERCR
ncbi:MAG TPA: hypothetical protein VGZ02_15025 [Candidatus Baltobacteraceae bacterium]|jgi:hypothetical protein|nr:hypothetical protein [Candidatus Baltobacteraceae bacterium]